MRERRNSVFSLDIPIARYHFKKVNIFLRVFEIRQQNELPWPWILILRAKFLDIERMKWKKEMKNEKKMKRKKKIFTRLIEHPTVYLGPSAKQLLSGRKWQKSIGKILSHQTGSFAHEKANNSFIFLSASSSLKSVPFCIARQTRNCRKFIGLPFDTVL